GLAGGVAGTTRTRADVVKFRRIDRPACRSVDYAQNAKDGYVSETVLPKDDSEPVLVNSAPTPDPHGPKCSGSLCNGLVILSLLFGVAGIGVGGWGGWQLRAAQARHQVPRTEILDLAAQTPTLQEHEQQLSTQLAQLPAAGELDE